MQNGNSESLLSAATLEKTALVSSFFLKHRSVDLATCNLAKFRSSELVTRKRFEVLLGDCCSLLELNESGALPPRNEEKTAYGASSVVKA